MTPMRLDALIAHCFRRRRRNGEAPKYREVAEFFQVNEATLRRWRTGETPIPRAVELVFEICATLSEEAFDGAMKAVIDLDAGQDKSAQEVFRA